MPGVQEGAKEQQLVGMAGRLGCARTAGRTGGWVAQHTLCCLGMVTPYLLEGGVRPLPHVVQGGLVCGAGACTLQSTSAAPAGHGLDMKFQTGA